MVEQEKVCELLDKVKIPYNIETNPPTQTEYLITAGTNSKTTLFAPKNKTDRLQFQFQINFPEDIQTKMNQMERKDFNKLVFDWTDKLTSYNVNWQFVPGQGNAIKQFRLTQFIEDDGFSTDNFYKTLEHVEVVGNQMIRVFQITLGNDDNMENSSSTPSFIT